MLDIRPAPESPQPCLKIADSSPSTVPPGLLSPILIVSGRLSYKAVFRALAGRAPAKVIRRSAYDPALGPAWRFPVVQFVAPQLAGTFSIWLAADVSYGSEPAEVALLASRHTSGSAFRLKANVQ